MLKKIEKIAKGLIILSLVGIFVAMTAGEPVYGDVTVSATVASMISCTTPLTSSDFGTIDNTAVFQSSPIATTTVNSNGQVYMKVYDVGVPTVTTKPGLYCSACPGTDDEKTIGSADSAYADTATLSAGTEGYGLQATTSASNNLKISTRFATTSANYVGGLEASSTNAVTVASSSAAVSGEVVTTPLRAAVSASQAQGSYSDTITFVCSST